MNFNNAILKKKFYINESIYLLIPFIVIYSIFLFVPTIWAFILSLQSGEFLGGFKFVGFENFKNLFQDEVFLKAIKNTFYYVFLIIPTIMLASLILAFFIDRMKRFQNFVKVCIILPMTSSIVPLALIWKKILDSADYGIFNSIINLFFKIPAQQWLTNPKFIIPSITFFEFWHGLGWWTIIFLGGLSSISREYYEAAEIDGANIFRQFIHVTIPLLKPTFIFLIIMGLIWNFQIFDSVYIMTRGGPGYESYTIIYYIYVNAFKFEKVGMAATMGVVILIIILGLSLAGRKLFREES